MLRAGALRRRVTVQQPVVTANALGEPIQTWSDVVKTWASIEPTRGQEAMLAMQVNAVSLYTITLRYYPDITPQMRLLYGERQFQIQNIQNVDERNRVLMLSCVELATNAAVGQ